MVFVKARGKNLSKRVDTDVPSTVYLRPNVYGIKSRVVGKPLAVTLEKYRYTARRLAV